MARKTSPANAEPQPREPRESRQESRARLYMIPVRAIVANTNPRYPLASSLEKDGWSIFPRSQADTQAIWPLATSDDPERRKQFIDLIQTHDPDFAEWAKTFITQGQLHPVEVRENGGDGKNKTYTLSFGCRRCLAILFNWCNTGKPKEPLIEAKLTKANNTGMFYHAIVENRRKNQTVMEDARAVRFALNQGQTFTEIAQEQGYSEATARRYDSLNDLPEEVQGRLHAGKVTVAKALAEKKEKEGGEVKPKMRGRKAVEEMCGELEKGSVGWRVLQWVLGNREEV